MNCFHNFIELLQKCEWYSCGYLIAIKTVDYITCVRERV